MVGKVRGGRWWLPVIGGAVIALGAVFFLASKPAFAVDGTNCLACHGSTTFSKTDSNGKVISLYVDQKSMDVSAHRYLDCTQCHPNDPFPHKTVTPLDKESLAVQCGKCHVYEFNQHTQSIHGQQLKAGNGDTATCVDCHSDNSNPHSVSRVLEYAAPTFTKNIAATCAKCHAQQDLMASYGIVEKVYESYMRSFHGKALHLGSYRPAELDKATCTNCHGVHDIKAVNDAASPVAGVSNLTKTCENCHSGATAQFALSFLGHKDASATNIPIAHYTEIFFRIFLIGVIAFGFIIMLLAVRKFIASRWRESE